MVGDNQPFRYFFYQPSTFDRNRTAKCYFTKANLLYFT